MNAIERLMKETLTLRAARSAYIAFSAIFGFIVALSALATASNHKMLMATVIAVGVLLLSWAWLIRFRVTMSSQSLTYTTLFGGTVTFDFEEIRSIRLESGIRGVEDRFKPFVRIVIEPLKESRQKPTYVNAKLLTKVDLAELRQTLRARFVSMGRSDVVKEL